MTKTTDIALPLLSHYRFVQYTLSTRKGSNDESFQTPVNEYEFAPGEIFFHGVHSLYRTAVLMEKPELKFREIPMERKSELSVTEELMTLYKLAIDKFVESLKNISNKELEEEIPSPLSGKPQILKEWFAQSVMHSIHHIGQAIRLQGISDRQLAGNVASFERASDYTPLYDY